MPLSHFDPTILFHSVDLQVAFRMEALDTKLVIKKCNVNKVSFIWILKHVILTVTFDYSGVKYFLTEDRPLVSQTEGTHLLFCISCSHGPAILTNISSKGPPPPQAYMISHSRNDRTLTSPEPEACGMAACARQVPRSCRCSTCWLCTRRAAPPAPSPHDLTSALVACGLSNNPTGPPPHPPM